MATLSGLVEAAGIEPASESTLPSGSTCIVCLQFNLLCSDRQEQQPA